MKSLVRILLGAAICCAAFIVFDSHFARSPLRNPKHEDIIDKPKTVPSAYPVPAQQRQPKPKLTTAEQSPRRNEVQQYSLRKRKTTLANQLISVKGSAVAIAEDHSVHETEAGCFVITYESSERQDRRVVSVVDGMWRCQNIPSNAILYVSQLILGDRRVALDVEEFFPPHSRIDLRGTWPAYGEQRHLYGTLRLDPEWTDDLVDSLIELREEICIKLAVLDVPGDNTLRRKVLFSEMVPLASDADVLMWDLGQVPSRRFWIGVAPFGYGEVVDPDVLVPIHIEVPSPAHAIIRLTDELDGTPAKINGLAWRQSTSHPAFTCWEDRQGDEFPILALAGPIIVSPFIANRENPTGPWYHLPQCELSMEAGRTEHSIVVGRAQGVCIFMTLGFERYCGPIAVSTEPVPPLREWKFRNTYGIELPPGRHRLIFHPPSHIKSPFDVVVTINKGDVECIDLPLELID